MQLITGKMWNCASCRQQGGHNRFVVTGKTHEKFMLTTGNDGMIIKKLIKGENQSMATPTVVFRNRIGKN
jgi:hypothetical protein